MSKNKKLVISLLVIVVLMAIVPLFMLKNAEFGGSDDAGSEVVSESRYGFFSNFCFKFFMLMNVKEENRHILRLCKYMYAREDMQYT